MNVKDLARFLKRSKRMVISGQRVMEHAEQQNVSQTDAIAFLSDPGSFDPSVNKVERIDTHAAIVFLAGDFAYKIKRAVKFNYLDFSTVEKRHGVCERELARNSACAPDMYLDVVPLVRTRDRRLALDEPGEVIEWVIRMKRFSEANLFDALAERGKLEPELMVALADTISTYHARAPKKPSLDADEQLSSAITSVVASLSSASDILGLDNVRKYSGRMLQVLNATRDVVQKRTRDGFVRLCHGDLHLQNIVLHNGRPTLFDAIEFDDDVATVDVLFDLSFVLMDLWRRNLKLQANILFNRYLTQMERNADLTGLVLLPMYLALRAGIRAMVTLDRMPFMNGGASRGRALDELKTYFGVAQDMLKPTQPLLIAVGGRSGTGKSTLAARLAPDVGCAPGAVHIRTDVERKGLFGVETDHKLGAHAYTHTGTEMVYRRAMDKSESALKAGHSVILDATFLSVRQRMAAKVLAEEVGAKFEGIWLDAEADTLASRIADRTLSKTIDPSDADAAVLAIQLQTDTGSIDWHIVNARGERESVRNRAAQVLGISN